MASTGTYLSGQFDVGTKQHFDVWIRKAFPGQSEDKYNHPKAYREYRRHHPGAMVLGGPQGTGWEFANQPKPHPDMTRAEYQNWWLRQNPGATPDHYRWAARRGEFGGPGQPGTITKYWREAFGIPPEGYHWKDIKGAWPVAIDRPQTPMMRAPPSLRGGTPKWQEEFIEGAARGLPWTEAATRERAAASGVEIQPFPSPPVFESERYTEATAESPGMKQEGAQFREWQQKYGGSPSLPPSDTPSATPTTPGAIVSAAQGASRLAAKGGFKRRGVAKRKTTRSKHTPAKARQRPAPARQQAAMAGDKYEAMFTGMYSRAVQKANANKKSGQAPWVPLRDYKNNKIFLVMSDGTALVFDVTNRPEISAYREALLSAGYDPNATAMVAEQTSKPLLNALVAGMSAEEAYASIDDVDYSSLVPSGGQ